MLDFLRAQDNAIQISLATWPDRPPLGKIPQGGEKNEVPVPIIFQHIAAIAEATVPPTELTCSPPAQTPSESDEESDQSSEWESEASSEEGMEGTLELDADMGDATFATS